MSMKGASDGLDLSDMRLAYAKGSLTEQIAELYRACPMKLFEEWVKAAVASGGEAEANAFTLCTVDVSGFPAGRVLLCKQCDSRGIYFFTNYESAKARELEAANGKASAVFYWPSLERQVRLRGRVSRLSSEENDRYFASRPVASQIGAKVSRQSEVMPEGREAMEAEHARLRAETSAGGIERPANWGGYLLQAQRIEFWQGRSDRLHDRLVFELGEGAWKMVRLYP